MNKGPGEEMKDIMEESPFEMGYGPEGQDVEYDRPYREPGSHKKSLLLGGAGVLILIILVIIFFGTGKRTGSKDLISIRAKLDEVGQRLIRLDDIENRIVLLEKAERGLRQTVSRLEMAGKSLEGQVGQLSQRFDSLRKGETSPTGKAQTSRAAKVKAVSKGKDRYYVVRRGDSLYGIARKNNLSVEKLCRLNKISLKQAIRPGQKLLIASGTR